MNALSIRMGQSSRRGRGGDKKRERKRTLREMKRLTGKVIGHGKRYAAKLRVGWKELTEVVSPIFRTFLRSLLCQSVGNDVRA